MKINRSTLILILSALFLGGFVYFYEIQGASRREVAKAKQQQIFSFKAKEVQSLTLRNKTQTLTFERSADKAQSQQQQQSSWLMKVKEPSQGSERAQASCQPEANGQIPATCQSPTASPSATASPSPTASPSVTTPPTPTLLPSPTPPVLPTASVSPTAQSSPTASPSPTTAQSPEKQPLTTPKPSQEASAATVKANEASVEFLLNALTAGKSDRKLVMTEPDRQRKEFGLDDPMATVEVKLKNQETHRLVLGKPDFSNSFLYAQTDSPADNSANLEVLLVSTNLQNAVNRPLSDWKKEEKSSQPSPGTSGDKKPPTTSEDKPSSEPSKGQESPGSSQQSEGTSQESQGSTNPSPAKGTP